MQIEPQAGCNVLGGVWFPKTGHINPRKMVKAMGRRALGAGVDIKLNTLVTDLRFDAGRYVLKTSGGEFSCGQLVLASGAQIKMMGDKLGIDVPVVPVRSFMWSTKPITKGYINSILFSEESLHYWSTQNKDLIEKGLPPSITHQDEETIHQERFTRHLYGKQTHDGCVIFGGDRRVVYDVNSKTDTPLNYAALNANKAHVKELVPEITNHATFREWTGVMPFSKDGTHIVG